MRAESSDDDASDGFVASDGDEEGERGGRATRRSTRNATKRAKRVVDEDSDGAESLSETDEDEGAEAAMVLDDDEDDDVPGAPAEASEPEEEEEEEIMPVRSVKRQAEQAAAAPAAKKTKKAAPRAAAAPAAAADEAPAGADDEAPAAAPAKAKGAAKKAKASPAPKKAAAASTKGPIAMEVGDTEATFDNVDASLWAEEASVVPSPLPERLAVLELFAGCGGLHLEGGVSFGDAEEGGLSIHTLAAVEIEQDPAQTYKQNHPAVNVFQMGVGRFLGTARRLFNLKQGTLPAPPASGTAIRVTDMRLCDETAAQAVAGEKKSGKTTARQDKDSITVEAARGERPLAWLLFRVHPTDARDGDEPVWTRDADTKEMHEAVHAFLNDKTLFGPKNFPLPGDVHVVTGGPPCQGWSGYNTQRVCSTDIMKLMVHKENRLLGRYLEVVWFYRPLYVVMEEVPDVAKKPEVMTWMSLVLQNKGYSMNYEKKLRTGLFGCPQTRDRLIVLAAMDGLAFPAMPPTITAPHVREADNVQWAYDTSEAAYPITMRCHSDGTVAAAEKVRREAADAELARIDEELGEAGVVKSKKLAKEYKLRKMTSFLAATGPTKPSVPRKKKAAAGDAAAAEAEEEDAAAPARRAAEIAAKAAKDAAEAAAAAAEALRVAGLMRALVLGDAISCDLPVKVLACGKKDREEPCAARSSYLCAPPTPYIAYLRQDMPAGGQVCNHTVLKMKLSDHLRCDMVPYRSDMCWRDMAGATGNLLQPQMLVLTDAEWQAKGRGCGEGQQFVNKIPPCMLADPSSKPKPKDEVKIPPLLHGWKLQKNRFPLVPFWCISMKHGKDKGCYGRLSYTEPHDTVHSYALPHWHVSLLPCAPRCLTVREKARVQGFPDSFVFVGDAQGQYKQIANAVSPQLGKAIGRSLLLALRAAHVAPDEDDDAAALQPKFTKSLRNFAEFLEDFDESALPRQNRPQPVPVKERELSPMTYEDIIASYPTTTRTDHSVRYAHLTPFEVLADAEDAHAWHLEAIVGIRRLIRDKKPLAQIAARWTGFAEPNWLPLSGGNKNLWAYKQFNFRYRARVEEVLTGERAFWCLPGVDPDGKDAPPTRELDAAKDKLLEYGERYGEELNKGWIKRIGALTKKKHTAKLGEDEVPDDFEFDDEEEAAEWGVVTEAFVEGEAADEPADDMEAIAEEDPSAGDDAAEDEADEME